MRVLATLLLTTTTLSAILSFFLGVSCTSLSSPLGGAMAMEKVRLGSSPPSCHNKCNDCNPCTAVQVPTLSGSVRVRPGGDRPLVTFSNYKPLGWKCRCGDRLYDP